MSDISLVQIVEAALLAAGKPMTVPQLAELFEEHERPETTDIREALKEVAERCDGTVRGCVAEAASIPHRRRAGARAAPARRRASADPAAAAADPAPPP